MDEVTDSVTVKEENPPENEITDGEPANDVIKKEELLPEFDEQDTSCSRIEIKHESNDGEEGSFEMASVMITEDNHVKFENEGGNEEDVLLKTIKARPGPRSRKRKQSESSETDRNMSSSSVGTRRSSRRTTTTSHLQGGHTPQTYRDTEVSQPDNLLHCDDCASFYDGDCPEHGPLNIVEDVQVPVDLSDQSRASRTAPPLVRIGDSNIPGAGCGVRAVEKIPSRTRFGPYEGVIIPIDECTSYSWLIRKDGQPDHCLDATEPGLSNWMRFINCSRHESERNLVAFQYLGKLYYRTTCQIEPDEELLVWCGKKYGRQLGLDSNDAANAKSVKENFKCPACPSAFVNSLYLKRHTAQCRYLQEGLFAGSIFKCLACPFTCVHLYYMERHKKTCQELQKKSKLSGITFRCSHCACAFANTHYLERHKKLCSNQFFGSPGITFQCSHCGYKSANTYYLKRHKKHCSNKILENADATEEKLIKLEDDEEEEQEYDEDQNTYACTQCYEVFYDEETLTSHQLTHAGENPLICKVCNERFFDLDTLTSHVQVHYGGDRGLELSKELKGSIGNGGSSQNSAACTQSKLRMREEPEEAVKEERFPCPHCGIQFFLKDSLTIHLRIHRGEKPFLCLECDVGFAREDYLRRHSRMHHEGKPFVCAECNKRFTELVYLKHHQRIHKVGTEE